VSRDVYVQDMPDGIRSTAEIPDGFRPGPLPFTPQHARAVIVRLQASSSFNDEGWAKLVGDGIDMEVTVSDDLPLASFAFYDRSADRVAADRLISSILDALGVKALDMDSEGGIFTPIK
jgi:hypothetical protein